MRLISISCTLLFMFFLIVQDEASGQNQRVADVLEDKITSETKTPSKVVPKAEPEAFILTAFNAAYENGAIVVSWSTGSEHNNARFEVERSVRMHKGGAQPWESLVFVTANGTSDTLVSYEHFDRKDLTGTTQMLYRLKQVSFDGSSTYSEVIEAKLPPPKAYAASSYTAPYSLAATIEFDMPTAHRVRLKVYDEGGRQVATLVNERKPAGRYRVKFDASDRDPGLYMYRLEMGGRTWVEPLFLVR